LQWNGFTGSSGKSTISNWAYISTKSEVGLPNSDPNLGYQDITKSPLFTKSFFSDVTYLNVKDKHAQPEMVVVEIQTLCQKLPAACSQNLLSANISRIIVSKFVWYI